MDEPSVLDFKHRMWTRGDLEWKLWAQQLPIYHGIRSLSAKQIEEIVILCARQFGKSHLGVAMALEDCLRYPNSCILITGPTIDQTREIVVPRLESLIRDSPSGLVRRLKSEKKWIVGASELVIGGFDVNSSSQRGKTVQNIYIEEVVDSDPDKYVESMRSDLGPALTHSKNGKMIFLTTLPKIPDHPFIIDTMAKAQMAKAFYSYTIDDNKELSKEQYEACVRRAGGRESIDFRREYLNEIIRDPNVVVVPSFNDQHVSSFDEPTFSHYFITSDWGGVRDHTVIHLLTHDFITDIDLVLDELWYPANTPLDHIVPDMKKWKETYRPRQIFADVPGALVVELNQTHGLSMSLPVKTDWQASINLLNVRFSTNKIMVHERCVRTIQALRSGIFNKQKTDFSRTEALGHCDAIASLMYGIRSMTRDNPWPNREPPETMFIRPKESSETQVAKSLLPEASFVIKGIKKFGNYK